MDNSNDVLNNNVTPAPEPAPVGDSPASQAAPAAPAPNSNQEPDYNTVFNVGGEATPAPAPSEPVSPAPAPSEPAPAPAAPAPTPEVQAAPAPAADMPVQSPAPAAETPVSQTEMPETAAPAPEINAAPVAGQEVQETPVDQSANVAAPVQNEANAVAGGDNEELLKAYVGKNYNKLTKSFNFAGFFLVWSYLFYRKMFGFGLLVFIAYIAIGIFIPKLSLIVTLVINLLIGLFVNKIYMSKANKKVALVKAKNPQSSIEALKTLCAKKGGTSIGLIFLGGFVEVLIIAAAIAAMVVFGLATDLKKYINVPQIKMPGKTQELSTTSKDGKLVQDVSINGYSCIGRTCTIYVSTEFGDDGEYYVGAEYQDLFNALGNYKEYLKVNLYYKEDVSNKNKNIIGYRTYIRKTNEDISEAKTDEAIREKLGLYSIGKHTAEMTLTDIGSVGFRNTDTYYTYQFKDENDIEYEMMYISEEALDVQKGNKYTVDFEVKEGDFGYDYIIESVN